MSRIQTLLQDYESFSFNNEYNFFTEMQNSNLGLHETFLLNNTEYYNREYTNELVLQFNNSKELTINQNTNSKKKYKTTSNEDRKRIIEAYLDNKSGVTISNIMNISINTVYKIIREYKLYNKILAKPKGGNNPKKLNTDQINDIQDWIDAECTLSLKQLNSRLFEKYSIKIHNSTINNYINSFNYSLKRISIVPERRNSLDVIELRKKYAEQFLNLNFFYNKDQIIFIDEVGFKVSSRPSRGRAPIGKPAISRVSRIRTRNISICCGMSSQGIEYYIANLRPFKSNTFAYFIYELINIIKAKGYNNALFIMDNVAFHKTIQVKEFIIKSGFNFKYLPPYSPFLNPIENMFSKWKEYTKRQNIQSEEQLFKEIINGSNLITQTDCDGYFKNMNNYLHRSLRGEIIED